MESVEGSANYSILLLQLVSKEDIDITIRISAAITFKNFVRRNWRVVSGLLIIIPSALTSYFTFA